MEIIKKEITQTVPYNVYKAYDGTEFSDSKQCELYEKSAECVVNNKIKNCFVTTVCEETLFGTGSEEYYYDVYLLKTSTDVDNLIQAYELFNQSKNHDNESKFLKDVGIDKYLVFGHADCDNTMWYYGTVKDMVDRITNLLTHETK